MHGNDGARESARIRGALVGLVALLSSSCAYFPGRDAPPPQPDVATAAVNPAPVVQPAGADGTEVSAAVGAEEQGEPGADSKEGADIQIYPGTGVFLDPSAVRRQAPTTDDGQFTLNFESTDIRDVVQTVLGDTLGVNYVIDPKVRGGVSLQTSKPVTRDALIPILESMLRMNGAVLVNGENGYRIIPAAAALRGGYAEAPSLAGKPLSAGLQLRVVPLEYIAAQEMQKILEPVTRPDNVVRVDTVRNLVIVSGTRAELRNILQTINLFDVNWLKGMSVGLFTLRNADIAAVHSELERLFGETSQGPLAGLFRLVPIERLNAMMVITPQPEYLEQAKVWVERLDRGSLAGGSRTLHIYRVQNGKAIDIAAVLTEILSDTGKPAKKPDVSLAPGRRPATIGSGVGAGGLPKVGESIAADKDKPAAPPTVVTTGGGRGEGSDLALGQLTDVRIIADEPNNALVVLATPREYAVVEQALERLDAPPRQVLVEATIAEVTLGGDLRYGLQWFFRNKVDDYTGTGSLDLDTNVPIDNVLGSGFTYAVSDSAGFVRAVLDVLAADDKIRLLSSPQLLVIDNQTASIQVGDQVPVLTATSSTDAGVVTESIQFRDTGVILEVTPRVNTGGMVTMEISQEVTDVGAVEETTGQRRFSTRTISSVVAVQSGQSVFLGGLIRERSAVTKGGIPGLYDLPIVGPLFGGTTQDADRTELIVLLTPKVVEDQIQAQRVTQEYREKLKRVSDMVRDRWQPSDVLEGRLPQSEKTKPARTEIEQ